MFSLQTWMPVTGLAYLQSLPWSPHLAPDRTAIVSLIGFSTPRCDTLLVTILLLSAYHFYCAHVRLPVILSASYRLSFHSSSCQLSASVPTISLLLYACHPTNSTLLLSSCPFTTPTICLSPHHSYNMPVTLLTHHSYCQPVTPPLLLNACQPSNSPLLLSSCHSTTPTKRLSTY